MAKKTRTVEYDVCDRCGREITRPQQCDICGKELCNYCSEQLQVTVERWRPDKHYRGVIIHNLHHEGVRLTACVEHAEDIINKLRDAGFKDFSYDEKPV